VQIPKWPYDADAIPTRVIDRTAIPLGVNNSPVLSGGGLDNRASSLPTTKVHGFGIEFMVRGGRRTQDTNHIMVLSANGHVTQMKAEWSGEGDDQIQEITVTASDDSGGEVRGAVVVRSAVKQHAVNVSTMYRSSIHNADDDH